MTRSNKRPMSPPQSPTAILCLPTFDRGFVQCFEAASGKRVWFERLAPGFSGSPIRVRDKLYCIDEEGEVIVLAASREFKVLARQSAGRTQSFHARCFRRTYVPAYPIAVDLRRWLSFECSTARQV